MQKFIKGLLPAVALAGLLVVTACGGETPGDYTPGTGLTLNRGSETAATIEAEELDFLMEDVQILDNTIFEGLRNNPVTFLQFSPLTSGEELAVLHTNHGDITLRFFPQEAPLAVENFKTHARNGYYDGVIFHRVIPNFMIQGGCPQGTGSGGESIWGQSFEIEPSFNLRHFRGALAMAHAQGNMGSQFYIVQNSDVGGMFQAEMESRLAMGDNPVGRFEDGQIIRYRDVFLPEEAEHFAAGGTPHLDWLWAQGNIPHPVFGHVVEGMDVVDAIAALSRSAGDRPLEDVIIESISFINAP
ncbi:MAG: peptidylprolyl isomerase [Defluviitaleaceae bacterium]|nr:peptidylprolyl isomerase [Defluviitaleaceae bacterium]